MADGGSNTFEIIIIVILIVAIVILATFTIYYSQRRAQCYNYPSPWCFNDWVCPNLPEDQQNRWDVLKNLGLSSIPPEQGSCFIQAGGTGNEPNQANCPNAWKSFLCGGDSTDGTCTPSSICTGPPGSGKSGPCDVPYSSNIQNN